MIAAVVAGLLADRFGLVEGETLFAGEMQESPSAQTVVHEYPGGQTMKRFGDTSERVDQPRIQIIVRGEPNDYADARARIGAIRDFLDRLPSGDYGEGTLTIINIDALDDVSPMGSDANERPRFQARFTCMTNRP